MSKESAPVGAASWPLALHLYETPGGNLIYAFPEPVGLNPSDNEKGFEALSGFQKMQPWEAFWLYSLAPAKWLVLSFGGQTVWEGRLEDRKLEPEGFRFTALGARRALDDAPYTALWSTKSFAGIKPVTAEEITKAAPERWAMDNNNRVWFGLVNGETYNNDDHYGLMVFRNPHRGEQKIKQITYNYDYTLPTNWKLEIMGYDEGFASGAVEQTYTGDGANHTATGVSLTLATPKDFVVFRARNATGGNVTVVAATGINYAKITNLRVKGTTSTNVYADEIAEGLVAFISTLNTSQLSSSYAGIQSPGLDLEDVLYEDMTPAAILDELARKGDNQTPPRKWEWGVWDNQLLYFRPQGDGALTWYVDVDELILDSTLETLVNQAYALYQDANNRAQRTTVASKADSYAQYGLYRRGVAQADKTTSATKADTARDTLLTDQATMAPRAQLTLYGLFDATGSRYPLWMLRSGDTVSIRNLPPMLGSEIDRIRTFRVTRKVYDVDNDLLTPTPEFALPNVEIQIASTLRPRTGNVPGLKPGVQIEPSIISPPVFA